METLKDIWAELGTKVRRFVGARVNDGHAADDITQDVLLNVQAQVGDLPAEDTLPAWVFAVARNAIVDHYRARAVRNHADIASVEPPAGDEPDERRDALRELTPCLARMIGQLPEPYRQAMRLADLEGLNHQELADRAGITLTAAKSRVRRARQHLREMLTDCCRIEQDVRGGVVDYETTERSARYCGTDDDTKAPGCGS